MGPPVVGSQVLFAKLFQLPGVVFKFKDSKGLDFGFLLYSVTPGEPGSCGKLALSPRHAEEGQGGDHLSPQPASPEQPSRWACSPSAPAVPPLGSAIPPGCKQPLLSILFLLLSFSFFF